VRADESPASLTKRSETPIFSWRLLCVFASKTGLTPMRQEIEPREWSAKMHTLLLAAKPESGGKMNRHFATATFNRRLQIAATSQSPCGKTLPFRLTFPQSTAPHRICGKTRARPMKRRPVPSVLAPQSAVHKFIAQRRQGAKNAKPVFLASLPLCVLAR
jgi:hypothetical protein